jgi:hypothetical protein
LEKHQKVPGAQEVRVEVLTILMIIFLMMTMMVIFLLMMENNKIKRDKRR